MFATAFLMAPTMGIRMAPPTAEPPISPTMLLPPPAAAAGIRTLVPELDAKLALVAPDHRGDKGDTLGHSGGGRCRPITPE